jgi:outer membrane protein assembly factor BamB
MATPTAVSDGELVWAMFGTGDLACLGQDGKIIWRRNLMKEYGECKAGHGYGSSPMVLDGKLYVALMHQGPSWFLALDSRTGTNIWKQDRTLEPKDEAQDSYSSPFILRGKAATELVLAWAERLSAYDPATGRELWAHGGLKVAHHNGRTISGPTGGEGMIVAVASGYQNQGYTVGFETSTTESAPVWTCRKFSPDCPSPIIYSGKVFMIRDDGMASCLNLKTGEPFWQERLFDANVKVSPVAGDGKVYFISGQANCLVLKASDRLEILSTNDLAEATLSSPCISAGHLFLRTDRHLFCIGR